MVRINNKLPWYCIECNKNFNTPQELAEHKEECKKK